MTRGTYVTDAGSVVWVSGAHPTISFDWYEENACFESDPEVDFNTGELVWRCDCHPPGRAKLTLRAALGGRQ
jgi:hypothetical protein